MCTEFRVSDQNRYVGFMTDNLSEWQSYYDSSKKQPLYIRWFITTYCNYRCLYCLQSHALNGRYGVAKPKNPFNKPVLFLRYFMRRNRNSSHSFRNFSPEEWSRAFSKLRPHKTALTISGGEPFLDSVNFQTLLSELSDMEHIDNIRIDSNGSFQLEKFEDVRWEKIFLNVSYHPSMISLDRFVDSIKKKINHGLNVTMVNFVMDPDQLNDFYRIDEALRELGIFVNANVYYGEKVQSARGCEMYKELIPALDVELKTKTQKTFGKKCYFPVFAYELDPTGMVNVGCFPNVRGDFMKNELPARPADCIPCPSSYCNCLDMYAFFNDSGRARKMNLLTEYVQECISHRQKRRDV
jgi:organic radical activating enzyme